MYRCLRTIRHLFPQRMAHPEGEVAAARAAQAAGTVFILSTISTSSIEEVAEAAPHVIKWFQLYIYRDREVEEILLALLVSILNSCARSCLGHQELGGAC